MGTSYRKRFLWQIAESELTSIQVAIKRRNLVNPIKSSAPLSRIFDPERHSLLVHLNRKELPKGSIFDRAGVVYNKEVTPDRSLDADGRRERGRTSSPRRHHSVDGDTQRRKRPNRADALISDQSSEDSEAGSPRIYRKNSNPKCCRDFFLEDELKKKKAVDRNTKNRCSKGQDGRGYNNKQAENRPSTSAGRGSNTVNIRRKERRRSDTSQSSSGSADRPANVHLEHGVNREQHHKESIYKQKPVRFKPSTHNNYGSGDDERPSHAPRYSKSRDLTIQRSSRSGSQLSSSSRNFSRIRDSAEWRRQPTGRRPTTRTRSRSRSRSISTADGNNPRSKSAAAKQTSYGLVGVARSRSRSLTPLRPGEYRPGKRKRLDASPARPSSRSLTEDRHHRGHKHRQRQLQQQQQQSVSSFSDYAVAAAAAHVPMQFQAFHQPAMFAPPPGPRPPRGAAHLAHLAHLAPFIQYVPVLQQARPITPYHPALYHRPPTPRPSKVYNSRPIPHFGFASAAAATTTQQVAVTAAALGGEKEATIAAAAAAPAADGGDDPTSTTSTTTTTALLAGESSIFAASAATECAAVVAEQHPTSDIDNDR